MEDVALGHVYYSITDDGVLEITEVQRTREYRMIEGDSDDDSERVAAKLHDLIEQFVGQDSDVPSTSAVEHFMIAQTVDWLSQEHLISSDASGSHI